MTGHAQSRAGIAFILHPQTLASSLHKIFTQRGEITCLKSHNQQGVKEVEKRCTFLSSIFLWKVSCHQATDGDSLDYIFFKKVSVIGSGSVGMPWNPMLLPGDLRWSGKMKFSNLATWCRCWKRSHCVAGFKRGCEVLAELSLLESVNYLDWVKIGSWHFLFLLHA